MKILALETSSKTASVAVLEDGKILAEFILNDGFTHSRKLVPMIDSIFKYLSLETGEVDYIAASVGPGSFTGLRIGVVTAKSMAMAADKKTVAVPTLDALAYTAASPGAYVCPMIDARNSQVYTCLYKSESVNAVPAKVSDYMALPVRELAQLIREKTVGEDGMKVIFTGDAAVMHREFFMKELGHEKCDFSGQDKMIARASSVARLAEMLVSLGQVMQPEYLVPFYLRKSSAEQRKEG